VDNIKNILRDTESDGIDWIDLDDDRNHSRALVILLVNLHVLCYCEILERLYNWGLLGTASDP
jgi:hypothetical protein